MKRIAMCMLALALAWPASGDLTAQTTSGFRVVVHPDNPVTTVTSDQLANIYFRRTTRWEDGSTVRPVDHVRSAPVREAFSRAVFGRSTNQMLAYWQQQIFSGRGVPPTELVSDAAVVGFVRAHPGAVGYVSSAADARGVRFVEVVR